jgi:hypothetical protein
MPDEKFIEHYSAGSYCHLLIFHIHSVAAVCSGGSRDAGATAET